MMQRDGTRVWTEEQIRALGVTTDLETAGPIMRMGRTKAYELARAGEFPTPVIRVGTKYVVPVAPILRALGLSEDTPTTDPSGGDDAT